MNGDLSRVDAEALANAAAAVAAAVANIPPDQTGQHPLAQHQVLSLQQAHSAEQDDDGGEGFVGEGQEGQGQARKPRKLRKPNDVARCQVDGCGRDLSDAKLYLRRYSVCEPHFKAEWVMLGGGRFRFCQQCNKFQSLDNFTGNRRSCKTRSEDRNIRRRKQRTDERAAAGDEADAMAGRLLKGSHPLGALSLPSRAALCDNGVLRQLGNDPSDPANQLSAVQYASQVQQFLLASGGAAAAGGILPASAGAGGGGLGGQMQMPVGMDLAAALVGADLSSLGAATQNPAALSLLTAVAAANGSAGRAGGAADGGNNNMLQQLQLAQLASALSKGGGLAAGGGAAGSATNGNGSLAAALGGVGLGMGLNAGALGGTLGASAQSGGLNGGNLAQQLLLQQAATAAAGGGNAGGSSAAQAQAVNLGALAEAAGAGGGFAGNLDLQSLMAQQLIQQSTAAGQGAPLLVLSNQNVMLLSLDQLGLLQQPQIKQLPQ